MAKIRIGFGTELNIGSEVSGIGTDNSTNTKQVLGNIHATNAKAIGIAIKWAVSAAKPIERTIGSSKLAIRSSPSHPSPKLVRVTPSWVVER